MEFNTPAELRDFLRICLDPGPGRDKRTPTRLADALPEPVLATLTEYAPYLGAFRNTAMELARRAEDMHNAYAAALLAWVRDEQPTDHVLSLVQAASGHAEDCTACTRAGVLSHRCPEGRRLAAAALGHATAEETSADEANATAGPAPEPVDRRLCPQNLVGDKAVPGEHFFKAAALSGEPPRCVYCGSRMTEPPAYRAPDGRLWAYAGIQPRTGRLLYENATALARYDVVALRKHYDGEVFEVWSEDAKPKTVQDCPGVGEYGAGLTGKTVHVGCCEPSSGDDQAEKAAQEAAAPTWVFNDRSVNRTTKHAADPDEPNVTLCPSQWQASKPIPAEEAARLALCGGCRRALTDDED
ncbi:hypothetical protein [Streptomyces sp. NPDC086782]|uniref:hypothetical protein n=1 Tax=Streptomyces sp. NPDC086782 TaxID=3365757 RepID=UPI003808C73A